MSCIYSILRNVLGLEVEALIAIETNLDAWEDIVGKLSDLCSTDFKLEINSYFFSSNMEHK